MHIIPVTQEAEVGGSQSKAKSVRLYLKNNGNKRANDVAQVVEHLPSKNKVLSSNPSTAKTVFLIEGIKNPSTSSEQVAGLSSLSGTLPMFTEDPLCAGHWA
jgi:hypothetical protein